MQATAIQFFGNSSKLVEDWSWHLVTVNGHELKCGEIIDALTEMSGLSSGIRIIPSVREILYRLIRFVLGNMWQTRLGV